MDQIVSHWTDFHEIRFSNIFLKNVRKFHVPLKSDKNNGYLAWIPILTHSMVQSPSRAANWFAASQEILRISRKPKVHSRTHKRPPPVPILGQPNPVHIPTSHLLEIRPNIIDPSTPRSPQWSLSLRFPHQDPIHPHLLTHTCHLPRLNYNYVYLFIYLSEIEREIKFPVRIKPTTAHEEM